MGAPTPTHPPGRLRRSQPESQVQAMDAKAHLGSFPGEGKSRAYLRPEVKAEDEEAVDRSGDPEYDVEQERYHLRAEVRRRSHAVARAPTTNPTSEHKPRDQRFDDAAPHEEGTPP